MSKIKYYNNGIENIRISENDPIPEGFVPGRKPLSAETREKMLCKRGKTNLERYGVENPFQLEKVKNMKLYNNGIENIRISENDPIPEGFVPGIKPISDDKRVEILDKMHKTCIEKYGVDNPSKSEMIKEKKKNTNIKRYGVENVFQSEEIKDKIKQTNLERYGVENPSQSEEIKEKKIQTCLEHYGVEHPLQSEEVFDCMKDTCIERFGFEYPSRSEEVKEKTRQTNLERYGVDWTCQREEARAYSNNSGPNQEFSSFLDNYNISSEREFHISSYSYDFKVGNILIEIDPFATHNSLWGLFKEEDKKEVDYHQKKSNIAEAHGYHVIHIFDWDDPEKIIKNLLLPKERIYARKTKVFGIERSEVREFLNEHHIQGTCNGQSVCLCLRDEFGELLSIMTFGKPRYNKNYQWELLRYCSSKAVIGGAEKLFKYFIKTYEPDSIISYCDRSKFRGDVYSKLGFELKSSGKPSKHWYSPKEDRHITDNFLRQRGYDQIFNESYGKGTSNEELIIKRGFVPIFDCGQDTYIFQRS